MPQLLQSIQQSMQLPVASQTNEGRDFPVASQSASASAGDEEPEAFPLEDE